MANVWMITSIGHCATKWLAQVLDAQPDITAVHELKMRVASMSWTRAAKYEERYGAESAKYRDYFEFLADAKAPIVVDSNSWAPWRLPAVHDKQPLDRVLYVVRHGVSQLHSLSRHSAAWKNSAPEDYIYSDYLQELWALFDLDEPETRWERLCLLWATIANALPDHLQEQGLPVEVVTFEQLTQTADGLQRVLPGMSHAKTLRWRKRDVNRKVDGPRRPGDLWAQWSERERADFRRICGPAMDSYDYEIPEVA